METLLILILALVLVVILLQPSPSSLDKQIRILYRQTARYAVASTQDESSVIKTLHANYAMGYLMALKDIATATDFKRATGTDLTLFESKITRIQDSSTVNLVSECQDLIPDEDPVLLRAMYVKV